jgi:hypothetical protein
MSVEPRPESRKAAIAKGDYCTMGPGRSAVKLCAEYVRQASAGRQVPTLKLYTIGEWSRRYNWVAAAAAYDADIRQQARLAQIEAVRDMNERHVNLARAMLGIITQRLQSLDPHTLTPADTARWADVCSKLERLARGEATERVDVYQRVRELAREMGLSATEEAEAVAAAERIVRGGV